MEKKILVKKRNRRWEAKEERSKARCRDRAARPSCQQSLVSVVEQDQLNPEDSSNAQKSTGVMDGRMDRPTIMKYSRLHATFTKW